MFDGDGGVTDLPVFLGHNPLVVPRASPPTKDNEDYANWKNSAGIPQFPDAVRVMLRASSALQDESYVPLDKFESTPSTGGLTLLDGKTIGDFNHLDLAKASDGDFDAVWALIDYTLEFSRGRATPSAPRSARAASCAGRRGRGRTCRGRRTRCRRAGSSSTCRWRRRSCSTSSSSTRSSRSCSRPSRPTTGTRS